LRPISEHLTSNGGDSCRMPENTGFGRIFA
jgi:hypothetical protein